MSHIVLYLFAALLAWAAFQDARDYLIPNRICVGVAALFAIYVLASPAAINVLPAVIAALAVFAVGLTLFSRGMLGGGDVKLMAAVTLWAGPALVLQFVFVTTIAGGLLSLAILASRLISRDGAAVAAPPVPYGGAVATGGLYVASRLLSGI